MYSYRDKIKAETNAENGNADNDILLQGGIN